MFDLFYENSLEKTFVWLHFYIFTYSMSDLQSSSVPSVIDKGVVFLCMMG